MSEYQFKSISTTSSGVVVIRGTVYQILVKASKFLAACFKARAFPKKEGGVWLIPYTDERTAKRMGTRVVSWRPGYDSLVKTVVHRFNA